MKFFKWDVIITKCIAVDNDGIGIVNDKFAKAYCKKNFTQTQYLTGRIPVIKKLREAHREAFGIPAGLKSSKEWLDCYYDYNLIANNLRGY